ncbi:MAG: ABC transporter permease [Vulcanimicrobiaceae bacterium]
MWEDLAIHLGEHIELSAAALALALVIGVFFGVAAAYIAPLRLAILALGSVGRTLPSLAVLMLLLPWLGVGVKPAIVALAILAIPPILINVDVAIQGVPRSIVDAALGIGMNGLQRFARVVGPTALPVAFAGVRTAATEVIASATLATFIGGGGLGDEIVRGLQTGDTMLLLTSTVVVAALAIAVDLLFSRIAIRLEVPA